MNTADANLAATGAPVEARPDEKKMDDGPFPLNRQQRKLMGYPKLTPMVNPLTGMNRNGPCLCGSGKKYKKCCHKEGVQS